MSPARTSILALFCVALLGLAAAPAEAGDAAAPTPPGSEPVATPDPAASPLHWHLPGEEEILASREGKPILYFFTAEWCAPCHVLKRTLFSDPEKVSRIAEWFVAVEVQDTKVETGKNLPEVDEVMGRYQVSTLPTMVVALPDGREVGHHRGYSGQERAWRWLNQQAMVAAAELGEK